MSDTIAHRIDSKTTVADLPPLLRTSERNDFKRCPWRWQQVWHRGLRRRQVPVWAWFGTAIHAGLETYYRPGLKRAKVDKVLDAFFESVGDQTGRIWQESQGDDRFDGDTFETEIVDGKVLGEAMLRGYIDHYDGDQEWEVIHTEQPFQINVPDPVTGEVMVVYAGTWDSLMRQRYDRSFWIWDHKTRKSFPSEGKWNFYNINDQAGSYLWVAPEVLKFLGIFSKKDKIEGLVFNALRKHLPDDRPRDDQGRATNKPIKDDYVQAFEAAGITLAQPVRKLTIADLEDVARRQRLRVLGAVSKSQPAELFHREEIYRDSHERVTQARRVQNEALIMAKMKSGELPLFKNPTEECTRCPVWDFCELDEQNPEAAAALAATIYRRVDPYRDHREDMKLKGGVEL